MMSAKEELRKEALEARRKAKSNDDGMAARKVAAQVIMLPELDHLKSVACYYPIKDELDSLVVMKALHTARFQLSLPVIAGNDQPLEFRTWDILDALKDGPFGTKEPTGHVITPEVLLVPLVAFDQTGSRLGYGGGYYDRTLAKLRSENPELIAVGLAYDNQKLDAIPVESYDQPLDMVVTEIETYRFD